MTLNSVMAVYFALFRRTR